MSKKRVDEYSSPTSPELKLLVIQKERLIEDLQKIYDLSKKLIDNDSEQLFLLQCSEIDDIRQSFKKQVFKIFEYELNLNPNALLNNQELNSFDEIYYKIKMCSTKLLPTTSGNKVETPSELSHSRPRLPKLELPIFDGNIEDFVTFYETFCSLVHNQPNIPKIDKFHYLLSCTRGSALNIVKSVPITASNYDVVWQSLLDKYQDNRMLVGRYLDKMLNFSPLYKESSFQLNSFLETFEHSYKAIQALKIDNLDSYILCHIALRALNIETRKSFEQILNQKCLPDFLELISFVHNQIKILDHSESYNINSNTQENKRQQNYNLTKNNKNIFNKRVSHSSSSRLNVLHCLHCGGNNHMIYRCDKFKNLSNKDRVSRADALKLCHNCLKPNHNANNCPSEYRCIVCKQPHHLLLHIDICDSADKKTGFARRSRTPPLPTAMPAAPAPLTPTTTGLSTCHASSVQNGNNAVILGTALVHVLDANNEFQSCRVMIDSGAQSNFISLSCAQRLGLPERKCPFNIYGLAGENVKNYGMTSCIVQPRDNSEPSFNVDVVILNKLTSNLPTVQIPEQVINRYKNLNLADPYFHITSPIDIILGSDVFPYVYDGRKFIFSRDIPLALGSVFGYIITGNLSVSHSSDNVDCHTIATTSVVSYTTNHNTFNETPKKSSREKSSPCEVVSKLNKAITQNLCAGRQQDVTSPVVLPLSHESPESGLKRRAHDGRRSVQPLDLKTNHLQCFS